MVFSDLPSTRQGLKVEKQYVCVTLAPYRRPTLPGRSKQKVLPRVDAAKAAAIFEFMMLGTMV